MYKKRILIFSLVYYPNFIGGAEVAIKEITDRLGREFEFDMITLRFDRSLPEVERIGNVNVYRVGWTGRGRTTAASLSWYLHLNKYLMPITAFIKAIKLHRRNNYEIFWSMMASYNSFAALFTKILFPKAKFLLTLQEGDPIPHIKRRARLVWPFFKAVFNNADGIQAISHYLSHFASEMSTRAPIVVVPNGVDIAHFTEEYTQDEINLVKRALDKREGDIFMITTSRLVPKNAVEDIIYAMSYLPDNIKLIVAGTGFMEGTLRKEAEMLGVLDRVQFIGWLSHTDMPRYFKACDIFIRTPISEGFGLSFVEAMAARLPVITTPVGGILDFLKERETGVFADVHAPETIKTAVMELVRSPELVSKIRRQAFEMVKEKYDWNIVALEMRKVFETI